jgi:hypothetical protein
VSIWRLIPWLREEPSRLSPAIATLVPAEPLPVQVPTCTEAATAAQSG